MVASNLMACAIGLQWTTSYVSLLWCYFGVVVAETLNGLLILPVHNMLGTTAPATASLANFGAMVPTVAMLWASVLLRNHRWTLFPIAMAFKCALIFFGNDTPPAGRRVDLYVGIGN
jgi:hypothetical protein